MTRKRRAVVDVEVFVGGVLYRAYMIDGVLRFRENAVVRDLVNRGHIDLNELGQRVANQQIDLRDAVEFWMMLGYSVDGLAEVFTTIAISTPDWTRGGERFPKEKP